MAIHNGRSDETSIEMQLKGPFWMYLRWPSRQHAIARPLALYHLVASFSYANLKAHWQVHTRSEVCRVNNWKGHCSVRIDAKEYNISL